MEQEEVSDVDKTVLSNAMNPLKTEEDWDWDIVPKFPTRFAVWKRPNGYTRDRENTSFLKLYGQIFDNKIYTIGRSQLNTKLLHMNSEMCIRF